MRSFAIVMLISAAYILGALNEQACPGWHSGCGGEPGDRPYTAILTALWVAGYAVGAATARPPALPWEKK